MNLCLSFNRSVSRGGQVWAPEGSTAFKCLLSARFCAALLSNISDCDETFNYWEPVSKTTIRNPKVQYALICDPSRDFLSMSEEAFLFLHGTDSPSVNVHVCNCRDYLLWQMHYLLYGTGMQTWEYSPLYAIRSYAYLWLHALPACLHAHVLQTNKVTILLSLQSLLLCFDILIYFSRPVA